MAKRPPFLNAGQKQESRLVSLVFSAALLFLAAVLCFDIWFTASYELVLVDGTSMENTLEDGDALYIDVHAAPERGDIIVLDVTNVPDYQSRTSVSPHYIIKRCIALAGDALYARNGAVYLKRAGEEDFSLLEEPYAKGMTEAFPPVEVGEGELFFLGDNRAVSDDSRRVGCLPLTDIVGVVTDFSLANKELITGWVRFWHPGTV